MGMTLLEIVEQARANVGGSANALARKLRLAAPTVLYWTWGITLPKPDKLNALAAVAQLDPREVRQAWLEAQLARHERWADDSANGGRGGGNGATPAKKRPRKPRPIRGGAGDVAPPPVVDTAAPEAPAIEQAPSYRTYRRAA